MGTLCARKDGRRQGQGRQTCRLHMHVHPLVTQQLHACSPMTSPIPILPEERSSPDGQGMQQHTHLARLGRGAALPLTLLAQRTGAATANASRIRHAQTPIGFSASFVGRKPLVGRATQRAIGLEGKVLPREAAGFPGQTHLGRSIARGGSGMRWDGGQGWSEFGGTHGIRVKLMAQFQTQVPHPLRKDLPELLAQRRVRTPAIWILLQVFIGERIFEGPAMQVKLSEKP